MTEEPGRSIYAEFINEQVEAEEPRKSSIEARGIAVITTSGALITALFGLAALVTGQDDFVPPEGTLGLLNLALVFFVLAAAFGLVTNIPLPYKNVSPEEMEVAVRELWDEPESIAQQRTSATRVRFLHRAQALNQLKGIILLVAFGFEVAAIGLLGMAVMKIL